MTVDYSIITTTCIKGLQSALSQELITEPPYAIHSIQQRESETMSKGDPLDYAYVKMTLVDNSE
ncbi:hypothetical protein Pmar_PMAR020931, partial [Perkinsus marinus ATCC 50983]